MGSKLTRGYLEGCTRLELRWLILQTGPLEDRPTNRAVSRMKSQDIIKILEGREIDVEIPLELKVRRSHRAAPDIRTQLARISKSLELRTSSSGTHLKFISAAVLDPNEFLVFVDRLLEEFPHLLESGTLIVNGYRLGELESVIYEYVGEGHTINGVLDQMRASWNARLSRNELKGILDYLTDAGVLKRGRAKLPGSPYFYEPNLPIDP